VEDKKDNKNKSENEDINTKIGGISFDSNALSGFNDIKTVVEKISGLGIDPNSIPRVSAMDILGSQFKTAIEKISGLGIDSDILSRVGAIGSLGFQFEEAAARFKEININDIEVNDDGTINYNNENIDVNKVISNAITEMNNCLNEETLFNRFLSKIIKIKNPLMVFVICFYIILPLLNNISLPSLRNTSDIKIARTFISQNINSSKKYAKTIQKKYRYFSTEHPQWVNLAMILAIEPIKNLYVDYVEEQLKMKLEGFGFLFIFKKKSNKKEINIFKKGRIKRLREELNNKKSQQIFLDECRFVNSDDMEIRNDCSLESQIIAKLQLGQTVKIIYKNNHWSLVEFSKNNEIIKGWIATHHLGRFD